MTDSAVVDVPIFVPAFLAAFTFLVGFIVYLIERDWW